MSTPNTELEIESTTEPTQEEGLLASLGLNSQIFAFQLLNFIVVIGIVWFLILKPLTKKLDERRQIIDESLDKAKEVESNLMMSEQKFQETLAQAKIEANAIIQKAHDEAENMSNDMKAKTKAELSEVVVKAKKTIAVEKEEMKAEIKKETAELVILAVEKILGQKMDGKLDEKFIKDILEK